MSRAALADDERAALLARQEAGDWSMVCTFDEGCRVGASADPADGFVTLDDIFLTPDEARREAQSLLAAADHAEFGHGEWRGGEWHPEGPRP